LRYLGKLYEFYLSQGRQHTDLVQHFLLSYLIGRTVKNEIRGILRDVLRHQKCAHISTVRTAVVGYLNIVFGTKSGILSLKEVNCWKRIRAMMKKWFLLSEIPFQKEDILSDLVRVGLPILGVSPKIIILRFIQNQLCLEMSRLAEQKVFFNYFYCF
jgi:hypothetical protein